MITVAGVFKAGPMWRYWGVYPAASGFFSVVTLLITWTINNQVRVLIILRGCQVVTRRLIAHT